MIRKPNQYDDDDGRVIVDMDIEGMKWHDRGVRREKRAVRSNKSYAGDQMTKAEARRYTFSAMLAGLTIVLIFSAVWVLFTLFATQFWFK